MSDPTPTSPDRAHRSEPGEPSKRPHNSVMPGLWIVATPIGNLGDMTQRACDVLAAADVIACEDTRHTGRLLKAMNLDTKMISYHDHSAPGDRARIIQRLEDGETVALVSDAGTPMISDPGYKLVREVIEAGHAVTCAPGASSPLAALVLSGLPTDRFLFAGYLPAKETARRSTLDELSSIRATLVFLESTRRLAASLADMADRLGDRPAAIARELTKRHEEVRRGSLEELAAAYRDAPPPKGEAVVVIGPPVDAPVDDASLDRLLADALATMTVRDAAAEVAASTGRRKREVYNRALEIAAADVEKEDE